MAGGRPDGAAGTPVEPGGAPAGDPPAAHVRADPRDPRALRAGEASTPRSGCSSATRTYCGTTACRWNWSTSTPGDRAGLPHPEGQATTCRRSRSRRRSSGALLVAAQSGGENTGRRAGRAQAPLRGRRGGPGRAGGRPARIGLGRPQRPGPGGGGAVPGAPAAEVRLSELARSRWESATWTPSRWSIRGGHWYLVGHDRDRTTSAPSGCRGSRREPVTDAGDGVRHPRRASTQPTMSRQVPGRPRAKNGPGGVRPRGRLVGDRLPGGRRGRAGADRTDGWSLVTCPWRTRTPSRR